MDARVKLSRAQADALAYLSGVDRFKKPTHGTIDALQRRGLVVWVNSFATQPRNAYDVTDDGRVALRQHYNVHHQCPECGGHRDLHHRDDFIDCCECGGVFIAEEVPIVAEKWRQR